MKRSVAEASAIGASLAAAGVAYQLAEPLWVVPVAGLGALTAVWLSLKPFVRKAPQLQLELEACDYDAEIGKVVRASQRIAAIAGQAKDPTFRERGVAVASALNGVIAHFREDPDDLLSSQKFLAVYVERTQAIMARYVQLEGLSTPQAEQVKRKVRDELLPLLVKMCETHLQRITYDDIRSFETDVDVLYKAINLEGL